MPINYLAKLMISKVTRLDLFLFFNSLLFLMMCIFFYFDRFTMFHGRANIHEFFFYAAVIFFVIFCVWLKFRKIDVPYYILVLTELTILIHFSGAFVEVDGRRLYEFRLFSVRYDKFVHCINSLIGSFVLLYLFVKNNYKIGKFICMITIFSVLGIGAIIEILEFIITLTVDNNGVGTYTNNMLDLVANIIGSTIGIGCYLFYKKPDLK